MKITRDLSITAAEFFHAVFDELVKEMEATDKIQLSHKSLKKGFSYVHKGEDQYTTAKFEIVDYQEDKFYKSVRTSFNGTTTISYEVTPKEQGITVIFRYEEVPRNADKKKTPKVLSMFSEAMFLGRMTDKLYNFQKKVMDEKEGIIEKKSSNPFIPDIRKAK